MIEIGDRADIILHGMADKTNRIKRVALAELLITELNKQYPQKSGTDFEHTYLSSSEYLISTVGWEISPRKQHAYDRIEGWIRCKDSIADVGCMAGLTGLILMKMGYKDVTFLDYNNLGLVFVRSVLPSWGKAEVLCYGQEEGRQWDWVIAMDVLEHVQNPITFIRWLWKITRVGAILTFPMEIAWLPPYKTEWIDGPVDVELLYVLFERLFDVRQYLDFDGGKEVVLLKK